MGTSKKDREGQREGQTKEMKETRKDKVTQREGGQMGTGKKDREGLREGQKGKARFEFQTDSRRHKGT